MQGVHIRRSGSTGRLPFTPFLCQPEPAWKRTHRCSEMHSIVSLLYSMSTVLAVIRDGNLVCDGNLVRDGNLVFTLGT